MKKIMKITLQEEKDFKTQHDGKNRTTQDHKTAGRRLCRSQHSKGKRTMKLTTQREEQDDPRAQDGGGREE